MRLTQLRALRSTARPFIMIPVLYALLPIFALIGLGLWLRRSGLTPEEHWVSVEQFSYWLLFPSMLIITLAKAEIPVGESATMAVTMVTMMLIMTALTFALRPILRKTAGLTDPSFTSVFQGSVRWHGFIALAVALNLYGDSAVALVAVSLAVLAPLSNVLSIVVMTAYGSGKGGGVIGALKQVLANPLIWGCVIGVTLNVTGLELWEPVETLLDLLGRAALSIGMLAIGAALRLRAAMAAGLAALITMILKLIIAPIVLICVAQITGLNGFSFQVAIICAAVPSAMNGFLLARKMGGDAQLYAAAVTLQTGAALITMPIWIALAQHFGQ
ncbi:MAG: AEC family transporter [Pikeienuella sp.]